MINSPHAPIPLYDDIVEINGHDYRYSTLSSSERMAIVTAWGRMSFRQECGKHATLNYNAANVSKLTTSGVDMLSVKGNDCDAQNLIVTLVPPTIVPLDYVSEAAQIERLQTNPTAGQTNGAMLARELAGAPFPGTLGPVVWPMLEAIITYGVGGVQSEIRCDYVNGLTLNLTASFVRVRAAISPSQRSGITGTSAAYVVGAFVGPGTTTAGRAQKTIYVGPAPVIDAVPGESSVFAVPRGAKQARLVGLDGTAAPPITIGTIRFWQSPDGVAGGKNVGNFFVSGNQNAPVEIPNAAMYFSVLNGQAATADYGVVFDLAV